MSSLHASPVLFAFAQPAPAPGREGQAPAPAPGQPTPEQGAPSGPPPKAPGFDFSMLLMIALPVVVIMFMSRSQKKQQQKLEQSLAVGTRVLLTSGLFGKIVELGETRARVEIAPGVSVQVLKSGISGVDAGEVPKGATPATAVAPAKDDAKDAKDKGADPKAVTKSVKELGAGSKAKDKRA